MKRVSILVCLGIVGLVVALTSQASVIPKMNLQEVFEDADTVVHGRVVSQSSEWKEYDGNRIIFTYSTVEVFRSFKETDRIGQQLVVRTVGGEVDGYHQALFGEATLKAGEEVMLFLQDEEDWTHPSVVGFHQGKYRVERDSQGKIVAMMRDAGQTPGAVEARVDARIPAPSFRQMFRSVLRHEFDGSEGDRVVHPLRPDGR